MSKLPKARLLSIRWRGWPQPAGRLPARWKPLYARIANAAVLYIPFFEITWRMPWLKSALERRGR
jgi:hypothetical protein